MTFNFSYVTVNELYNILVKLDAKKATGFDEIPSKFLQIGAAPLAVPIAHIVNLSIQQCIFPTVLKNAELAALVKKLDSLMKENYRPVSILTAVSKVFENVFNSQMFSHFDMLFSKFLSGFRRKYSCQTTLIRMIEEWKGAIDNHQIVGTVAIDWSKAFDSLPHGLLLAKLSAYRLDINSCKLMASYLYNRHQRVKIGPQKSDWSEIKRGVPQGSFLGPLLSNVFINDIFFLKFEAVYLIMQMTIVYHVSEALLNGWKMFCQEKPPNSLNGVRIIRWTQMLVNSSPWYCQLMAKMICLLQLMMWKSKLRTIWKCLESPSEVLGILSSTSI